MRNGPPTPKKGSLLTGAEPHAGYGSFQTGPSSGNTSINNDSSPGHSITQEEMANINGRAFLNALVQAKEVRSASNTADHTDAVRNLLTLVNTTPINFNVKDSDGLTAMDHICLTSDKDFFDILIQKEVNLKNGDPLGHLLNRCVSIVKMEGSDAQKTSALERLKMSEGILTKVQSSWTAADYCTCVSMLQTLVNTAKKNTHFKPVSDAAGKILIDVKNTMVEKTFISLELYFSKSERNPLENPYTIDIQEVVSPRDIYNYMVKQSLLISDPKKQVEFFEKKLQSGFQTFFQNCEEGGPQILKEINTKLEMMRSQLGKMSPPSEDTLQNRPN